MSRCCAAAGVKERSSCYCRPLLPCWGLEWIFVLLKRGFWLVSSRSNLVYRHCGSPGNWGELIVRAHLVVQR